MGWKQAFRAQQAALRRAEREERRQQRELQQLAKERARLTVQEQAKLEVDTFENSLQVLLSLHKQQGETWDWKGIESSLPPPRPRFSSSYETQARIAHALQSLEQEKHAHDGIARAKITDREEFERALNAYSEERAEWEELRKVARGILTGDPDAYLTALHDLGGIEELSELKSSVTFAIHTPSLVECAVVVSGTEVIPSELKALTSTGKVSVKNMPKQRFHEIYQDYVCGCMLRVAREVLALLPVEDVLVTASVDLPDDGAGGERRQPVLSAALNRARMASLDFGSLDPSDTIETFHHRGDFKASRKSEAFRPILPLSATEVLPPAPVTPELSSLMATARLFRGELQTESARFLGREDSKLP